MGAGIAQLAARGGRAHAAARPDRRGPGAGRSARGTGSPKKRPKEAQPRGGRRGRGADRGGGRPGGARRVRAGDRGGAGADRAQARAYAQLAEIVSSECVLASNTSSLPITAIAARPCRARSASSGMHFFNPAPLMRLLEVVAGALSDERALALATRREGDGQGHDQRGRRAGFLVNRCNRPFGLEALRLLSEQIADVRDDRQDRALGRRLSAWARSSSATSSASTRDSMCPGASTS